MARRNTLRFTLAAAAVAAAFAVSAPAAARDETVALTGTQAPGLPAGVNFSFLAGNPQLNDAGQVAFSSFLAGTGVGSTNDEAIYRGTTLVARDGNAAPGLPAGVNFGGLVGSPQLNEIGRAHV